MKMKVMYSVFLAVLSCSCLFANTEESDIYISGRVYDEFGPMPGVIVLVKATFEYVETDSNGEFFIDVPSKNSVLIFSMEGLIQQEVTVGSRTFFDIFMSDGRKFFTPDDLLPYRIISEFSF